MNSIKKKSRGKNYDCGNNNNIYITIHTRYIDYKRILIKLCF